jgi:hypothetical protein
MVIISGSGNVCGSFIDSDYCFHMHLYHFTTMSFALQQPDARLQDKRKRFGQSPFGEAMSFLSRMYLRAVSGSDV